MGMSSFQPCYGASAFSITRGGHFWLHVTSRQLCHGWGVGATAQTIPAPSCFPSSLTSALLWHMLCNSQEN